MAVKKIGEGTLSIEDIPGLPEALENAGGQIRIFTEKCTSSKNQFDVGFQLSDKSNILVFTDGALLTDVQFNVSGSTLSLAEGLGTGSTIKILNIE